jgi:hypothetical protein
MGDGNTIPKTRQDPAERAAAAALSKELAAARGRRAEAEVEYNLATENLFFTKDFNTALEATMRDGLASPAQRILAYVKRYSWGEYSPWAIGIDGHPRYQVDCANELKLNKRLVSKTVAYLQARGYLEDRAKLLYPVIAPQLTAPDPKSEKSPAWTTFIENWKVANAGDFQRWEDARAVDKHFRKVVHAEYRQHQKSQTPEKKGGTTLLRSAREGPKTQQRAVSSPLEASNRRHQQAPANPPVDEEGVITAPEAAAFLFGRIDAMQKAFPDTLFAKPAIDPNNTGDQGAVNRILKELGARKDGRYDEQHLVGYIVHITAQFKGCGLGGTRKALRHPGSPTGPDSLGLLINWARDYARIAGRGGAVGGGR